MTASWVLMVVFGFAVLWLMRRLSKRLYPVMERLAAAAFVGAGLIGASGWLGEAIRGVTGWLVDLGDQAGQSVLGVTIVWILAAALGFGWLGAFLPRKWVGWDYPDWLIVGGFFLPSLLTGVPGVLGQGLRAGTELAGNAAVDLVGLLIGGA